MDMETKINNGCEMVTSWAVNPARNDVWWSHEQWTDHIPPTGYKKAEPNDYAVMWAVDGMNFDTQGYGVMMNNNGVETFMLTNYGFTYYWCKSGDITSMRITNTRTPSWQFAKNKNPHGSPNAYCKARYVVTSAPKMVFGGFGDTQLNSMSTATKDYYLGTTTVNLPKLPILTKGVMNENIMIDPYFTGLSVSEVRDMIQREQSIKIPMIWTQEGMVTMYWTSGLMNGTNTDLNYHHFEIGEKYKFLVE